MPPDDHDRSTQPRARTTRQHGTTTRARLGVRPPTVAGHFGSRTRQDIVRRRCRRVSRVVTPAPCPAPAAPAAVPALAGLAARAGLAAPDLTMLVVLLAVLVGSSVVLSPSADALTRHQRDRVVHMAASKKGTPYRYGADGPKAFDCSGFTQWVFRRIGKQLPRTSRAQARATRRVRRAHRRRGDLVFFSTHGRVYHVGHLRRPEPDLARPPHGRAGAPRAALDPPRDLRPGALSRPADPPGRMSPCTIRRRPPHRPAPSGWCTGRAAGCTTTSPVSSAGCCARSPSGPNRSGGRGRRPPTSRRARSRGVARGSRRPHRPHRPAVRRGGGGARHRDAPGVRRRAAGRRAPGPAGLLPHAHGPARPGRRWHALAHPDLPRPQPAGARAGAGQSAAGRGGRRAVRDRRRSRARGPEGPTQVFDLDGTRLAALASSYAVPAAVAESPAAAPRTLRPRRLLAKQRAGAQLAVLNHVGAPPSWSFRACGPGRRGDLPVLAAVAVYSDVRSARVLVDLPGLDLDARAWRGGSCTRADPEARRHGGGGRAGTECWRSTGSPGSTSPGWRPPAGCCPPPG